VWRSIWSSLDLSPPLRLGQRVIRSHAITQFRVVAFRAVQLEMSAFEAKKDFTSELEVCITAHRPVPACLSVCPYLANCLFDILFDLLFEPL
jgi:hypothetical protein